MIVYSNDLGDVMITAMLQINRLVCYQLSTYSTDSTVRVSFHLLKPLYLLYCILYKCIAFFKIMYLIRL